MSIKYLHNSVRAKLEQPINRLSTRKTQRHLVGRLPESMLVEGEGLAYRITTKSYVKIMFKPIRYYLLQASMSFDMASWPKLVAITLPIPAYITSITRKVYQQ